VVRDDGVVLVRRGQAPLAGEWTIPGGRVELGETLVDAVRREIEEETGLVVEVGPVLAVLDRIHRDPAGRVLFHFVIIDYVCRERGGTLRAGSDAADVAVVAVADLDRYAVAPLARRVIDRGLRTAAGWNAGLSAAGSTPDTRTGDVTDEQLFLPVPQEIDGQTQ
jgi:8-oxo-dGTP diphosphatase